MKFVDPESVLPNEFFNVRQETTPKAPVNRLMFYAALVYLIIGVAFAFVFITQLMQEIKFSSTQVYKNAIVSDEPDTSVTCSPIGIISSPPNTPKITCLDEKGKEAKQRCEEVGPMNYNAILGVAVQYSESGFQIPSVEHCCDLLPTESDWKLLLNCGPGGRTSCWLFIDFEELDPNMYPAKILREVVNPANNAYTRDRFEPLYPIYVDVGGDVLSKGTQFQEFVYDRKERRWVENPNSQAGSSGVYDMERYLTLRNDDHRIDIRISGPWYRTNGLILDLADPNYSTYFDWTNNRDWSYYQMSTKLCQNLFSVEQVPYSCETVTTSHPTYLEAASVAYTTAGLIASALLPFMAFVAGKMEELNGKKEDVTALNEKKGMEMSSIMESAGKDNTFSFDNPSVARVR
jgi:hypothetical protein